MSIQLHEHPDHKTVRVCKCSTETADPIEAARNKQRDINPQKQSKTSGKVVVVPFFGGGGLLKVV